MATKNTAPAGNAAGVTAGQPAGPQAGPEAGSPAGAGPERGTLDAALELYYANPHSFDDLVKAYRVPSVGGGDVKDLVHVDDMPIVQLPRCEAWLRAHPDVPGGTTTFHLQLNDRERKTRRAVVVLKVQKALGAPPPPPTSTDDALREEMRALQAKLDAALQPREAPRAPLPAEDPLKFLSFLDERDARRAASMATPDALTPQKILEIGKELGESKSQRPIETGYSVLAAAVPFIGIAAEKFLGTVNKTIEDMGKVRLAELAQRHIEFERLNPPTTEEQERARLAAEAANVVDTPSTTEGGGA